MNEPITINYIGQVSLKVYEAYLEPRGCRLEPTEGIYLLHLSDEASCTTSGPFDSCMFIQITFPDQAYFFVYKELHRDGTSWSRIHIPEKKQSWPSN